MSKKFSSFDQQQLIMENFRKFINEGDDWDWSQYDKYSDRDAADAEDSRSDDRAKTLNDLANGKPADMEIKTPEGTQVSLGAKAKPEEIEKWLEDTAKLMENDPGVEHEIEDSEVYDAYLDYLDNNMKDNMKKAWDLIKQKFENDTLGLR